MAEPSPTPETRQADLEARARQRAEQLAGTIEIHGRYDWGDDLLTIDPDDVLVDRPEAEAHENHAAHPSLIRVDFEQMVDEAYVGRVLERGEALLADETALDLRQELRDCLEIVEDLTIPPHVVGFHVAVLAQAARDAKAARAKRDEAGDEPPDSPARRVRLAIESLLESDGEGETADAAIETLRGLGETAGWAVIGRLHFEGLTPTVRKRLLEVALDTDEPLAVTLVIHEAMSAFQGKTEGVGADHGIALTSLLTDRKDRRAIPLMSFVLKSDTLDKETREKIVKTLQDGGMWGEVSEVIGSFKGNWPLVAPAGLSFEAFAARIADLEGVDAKNQDAVDAYMEKANAHWHRIYREDLGYLRTCDADRPGEIEQEVMRQFTAEASHLVQDVPDEPRIKRRVENFREEWMRNPLRSLDGRRPLAAILAERIQVYPSEMGQRRARRTIQAKMLQEVREHLRQGRPRRAKASLAVLDELAPGYPPAARVRIEIEKAG